jgi:group I intron endonuclease
MVFDELLSCNDNEVREKEQIFLNHIHSGNLYNIASSSIFGDVLTHHPNKLKIITNIRAGVLKRNAARSDAFKKRLSESLMGSKNPNWRGGKTFCECGNRIGSYSETCGNCRDRSGEKNPFYGKSHSEETKRKLSEKRKGEKPVNSNKITYNSIVFLSQSDLAKYLNVSAGTITNWIRSGKIVI